MDKTKLAKLRLAAKRTLKILDFLEEGLVDSEIVQKLAVERPLVAYYRKVIQAHPKPKSGRI